MSETSAQSTAKKTVAYDDRGKQDPFEEKELEISGEHLKVDTLKQNNLASWNSVIKKINEVELLMGNVNKLHVVKTDYNELKALVEQYGLAFQLYSQELSEEEKVIERGVHDSKLQSIDNTLSKISVWISNAEVEISENISVTSRRSGSTRSLSASIRERAKLAELIAERSLLKRKQALRAASEELALETEIAKTEARQKVIDKGSEEFESGEQHFLKLDKAPLKSQLVERNNIDYTRSMPPPKGESTTVPSNITPRISSAAHVSWPATLHSTTVLPAPPNASHDPVSASNLWNYAATTPFTPMPQSSPTFYAAAQDSQYTFPVNPTPSTVNAPPKFQSCPGMYGSESSLADQAFQSLMSLHQKQNETIIATHRELTTAISLPQPTVPIYKGDLLEYKSFVMAFDTRIRARTKSSADLLYYLNQHLDGEPKELIEGCLLMNPDDGYREARRILEKEYGDPFKVSRAYINKAIRWQPVKHDDAAALKKFSVFLIKCKNAMNSIDHMAVLNHAPNLQSLVSKLPTSLQNKWREKVLKMRKANQSATFKQLAEYVEAAAEAANDPVFGREAMQKVDDGSKSSKAKELGCRDKTPRSKKGVFATTTDIARPATLNGAGQTGAITPARNSSCPLCGSRHDPDDCEQFNRKSIEERKKFLKDRHKCFGCYGDNHLSKGCTAKRTCRKCQKPHPTALHIDGFKPPKKNGEGENATTVNNGCVISKSASVAAGTVQKSVVLHAILPVRVKVEGSASSVETYAFYDSGSDGCFLTEELRDQLGEEGTPTQLRLRTMHGSGCVDAVVVKNLIVTDINGDNAVDISIAYTQTEIPVSKEQIPTSETLSRVKSLSGVVSEIPRYRSDLQVGLLIGSNCPSALEPLEVVPGDRDGPFAMRLRHGWTVSGPLEVSEGSDCATSNRIMIRPTEKMKDLSLEQSIQRMFEADFNDRKVGPDAREYSQEDKKFLRITRENMRIVNGHYELPLPFKNPNVQMPNNREQAVKRAQWQKKKMLRDEKYREDYVTFMNELVSKGYASKVPEDREAPESGKQWYIPTHGVYNPRKPGKIRVVLDCSARFGGTSLNDQLIQGPDLTNALVGVLNRFREARVAFMGDIESMFFQVRVPENQRSFLRFLWWPDGDLEQELQEYEMNVHPFGACSSPSCANLALRQTADDNEEVFGPLVSDTIRRNFYVDDCLRSVEDETVAVRLIEGLRKVCANGGFRLRKFTSNSRAVLDSVPPDERSKETRAINLDYDCLPIERALGVEWCIQSDTLGFRIAVNDKPLTRRGILSVVSSIFDPLGLVAPFSLPAKLILQELVRDKKLGWDDEIPENLRVKWLSWRSELPLLEKLKIERCVKPPAFGEVVCREVHVFSDASSYGYGAAAYLRLMDDAGRIHCSLLFGKARLAPIKATSIPRLELTAATVAVRIGSLMIKELSLTADVFYHTDSTTVLRYIANDHQRFHVFVANRIQLIRDNSDIRQWRYVETSDNPADDASRGLNAQSLLSKRRWFHGPEFLRKIREEWPEQPFMMGSVPEDDPEVKKTVSIHATSLQVGDDATARLISHFSDWRRLCKAVAVFLRVKQVLRKRCEDHKSQRISSSQDATIEIKSKNFSTLNQPLGLVELDEAELAIIRYVQSTAFGQEIAALEELDKRGKLTERQLMKQKKVRIKNTSSIYRLDPYIDDGVLRVGGRLRRSNLPDTAKYPVILPRKNHVTVLLIRDVHQRLGHIGRNHVIAALREKYWIVSANSAVRSVIAKCVFCRRHHGCKNAQKMADLPTARVTAAPPFTFTGVDYFGPFVVKNGRREIKLYGVLFTCLASRAVHLEVASSLESDTFILALRRFITRRGPVREMRSDNGTNFVGAERELREAIQEMKHNEIREKMQKESIDWIFNPPTASHMGGSWERQIRSTRKVLAGLLREHGDRLDEETFRTLMCEVESVINSRPLTTVSSDPKDLDPLTPNQVLTGKSKVVLPPPGNFQRADVYLRRRWRQVQYLTDTFWRRWKKEYLVNLQERSKWLQPRHNLSVGDVVLIQDDNAPRSTWSIGRVTEVETDKLGCVRAVVLRTAMGVLRRPIHKLVMLLQDGQKSEL